MKILKLSLISFGGIILAVGLMLQMISGEQNGAPSDESFLSLQALSILMIFAGISVLLAGTRIT